MEISGDGIQFETRQKIHCAPSTTISQNVEKWEKHGVDKCAIPPIVENDEDVFSCGKDAAVDGTVGFPARPNMRGAAT